MGRELERARSFAERLAELYRDDLRSVLLYGSAARGQYREKVSDLNLLVILEAVDDRVLRRGSELAREWVTEGNPPPLVLSAAEWAASADVFPIEYSDIRDAHEVLAGAEPFGGIEIGWEHLRLQCEHELKSKQIGLREHFLLSAEDPEGLGRLLLNSFPTFLTLFRAGLRLIHEVVPQEDEAVIAAMAARAGFDPAPFEAVAQARRDGAAFAPTADGDVVPAYLAGVRQTTVWLDRLQPPTVSDRV